MKYNTFAVSRVRVAARVKWCVVLAREYDLVRAEGRGEIFHSCTKRLETAAVHTFRRMTSLDSSKVISPYGKGACETGSANRRVKHIKHLDVEKNHFQEKYDFDLKFEMEKARASSHFI